MYCAQVLGWGGDERELVLPCVGFGNGDGSSRLSHSSRGFRESSSLSSWCASGSRICACKIGSFLTWPSGELTNAMSASEVLRHYQNYNFELVSGRVLFLE